MKYDSVSLTAYSSGSTALNEPLVSLSRDLVYSSIYPGGFEQASFFIPHQVATEPLKLQMNQRVKVCYGLRVGWEGLVTNLIYDTTKGGTNVQCTGYFGSIMNSRELRKPWADARIDENVWVLQTVSGGGGDDDWFEVKRAGGQLSIAPKQGVDFVSGDDMRIRYTAPTGQTIKRLTYTLTFEEGGQTWETYLYAGSPAETIIADTQYTSDQSAVSEDYTFSTGRDWVEIRVESKATQTAPKTTGAANKVRAVYDDLIVYTETGSINLTEIAKDIRGYISELSASERLIGSCTTSLVPFLADPLPYATILAQAASYGDTSFNPWAYGVWGSDLGSDDKPVLFVEQIPLLTDYDYIVRLDSRQMANTTFEKNIDAVRNWIAVQYKSANGREVWITPDDDADLKDTTSIALYGQREEWITINTTSSTTATTYGKRLLARRKDAQWVAPSGIAIVGHCYTKAGAVMPAAMLQAGKRLKIANFLNDLSGKGLTWLITRAEYEHATRTATVEVGIPDTLPTFLAGVLKNEGK